MFIVPSIASADYLNLGKCVEFADKEYGKLHFTIADGNFVPYITFGMRAMGQICDVAKSILSVHLLVTNPLAYAEPLARCYPETVFLHLGALPYPCLLYTSLVPPQPERPGRVQVRQGGLNLRIRPSTAAPVLTVMPNGAPVTILGQWQNWLVVEYRGQVGYAAAPYIRSL